MAMPRWSPRYSQHCAAMFTWHDSGWIHSAIWLRTRGSNDRACHVVYM
jgi:hypothetical protein